MTTTFKYASIGEISHGTLRTEDLLSTFMSKLEGLILINGGFLALPENRSMRDRLNNVIGECQDAFDDDGELKDDNYAAELLGESVFDALNEFAPPYCVFSSHEGDGSSFGFWPDVEAAKDDCGFASTKGSEFPEDDFEGEWLHINERGNTTLYIRTNGADAEIWSVV